MTPVQIPTNGRTPRRRMPRSVALLTTAALLFSACTGSADPDASADATSEALDGSTTVVDEVGDDSPSAKPSTTSPNTATDLETDDATADSSDPSSEDDAGEEVERVPGRWIPVLEPGVGGRVTDVIAVPGPSNRVLAAGDMLGVAYTEDDGLTWLPTTGFVSWEIGSLTVDPADPDHLWAGTMSGPHVSTDAGETWTLQRDGMGATSPNTYTAAIELVLFDPAVPGRLLAFGGSQRDWASPSIPQYGAVWESNDTGKSWTKLATLGNQSNITAAAFLDDTGERLIATTLGSGVFTSDDGGETWGEADDGLPHGTVTDVAVHPEKPDTVWVTLRSTSELGGGLFISRDGATTWEPNDLDLFAVSGTSREQASFLQVAISPKAPWILHTANIGNDDQAVYRSLDEGATWQRTLSKADLLTSTYSSGPAAEQLSVDPDDPNRVFLGQSEYILLSDDGGQSWNDISATTEDGLTHQGNGFSGLVATDIAYHPDEPERLYIGGRDGANLLVSLDGGERWTRPLIDWDPWGGSSEILISGDAHEKIHVVLGQARTFNGIARSFDQGLTWEFAVGEADGLPERGSAGRPGTVVSDPDSPDRYWATIDERLYVTTDAGSSWRLRPAQQEIGTLYVRGGDVLFAGGENGLIRSADAGETFETIAGTPPHVIHIERIIDPEGVPGDYLIVSSDPDQGGLWRWNGDTWNKLRADPAISEVIVNPSDVADMILVTDDDPFHDVSAASGIWITRDGGQNWTQRNDGLPMTRVDTVEIIESAVPQVMIGTTGRGFYSMPLEELLVP